MSNIITQQKAILGYLKKYPRKGITTYEAFANLGVTKLTTRISEMRQAGYKFTVIKERNEHAIFNRYFLQEEPKSNNFTKFLENFRGVKIFGRKVGKESEPERVTSLDQIHN